MVSCLKDNVRMEGHTFKAQVKELTCQVFEIALWVLDIEEEHLSLKNVHEL